MSGARRWTTQVAVAAVALIAFTAPTPPHEEDQGTQLHGTWPYESVNIGPVFGCGFDAGALSCPTPTPTFQAPYQGRVLTYQITAVRPHCNVRLNDDAGHVARLSDGGCPAPPPSLISSTLNEYAVKVQDGTGPKTDLCGQGGYALAVPNAWTRGGEIVESPNAFTFACVPGPNPGGVIVKCIDWGYPPWPGTPAGLTNFTYDQGAALRFHQTCVRMATADYCGEGATNTIDGTPIGIVDRFSLSRWGLATFSPSDGGVVFRPTMRAGGPRLEAIWGIDGCGRSRVLCLSKARWDTLSLDGTCVDKGMARRISSHEVCKPMPVDGTSTCHQYPEICEAWNINDLMDGGTTLVSYSGFWDRALVRFAADGGSSVTTSKVSRSSQPPDPFTFAPGFHEVMEEGKVFADPLPPKLAHSLDVIPLYRCQDWRGRSLTTTYANDGGRPCSDGHGGIMSAAPGIEGYIFRVPPATGESRPLHLFRSADGGQQWVTTTLDQVDGYSSLGTLGYLPLTSPLGYQP